MRRIVIALALVAAASTTARGDFTWGNSTARTNRITYANGVDFIAGNKTNPDVGCFVQLIYAGANGTNDSAINAWDGVTVDDVVVSNFWMGVTPTGSNGYTSADLFTNDVVGFYFVRVWTAPSPFFTNGLVPTSPTNFYGDSALFSNACPSCAGPFATNFDFGGTGFATTLTTTFTDSDGDGLPDWWEVLHFGGATNATAANDDDGDGVNNYVEYISGTDPMNNTSVFKVTTFAGGTNGTNIVRWNSVAARTYELRRFTNILSGFEVIATNLAATPPANVYTDVAPPGVQFFYGVTAK